MATKKQDTRYMYRRGPVWYVKITTPDGRRLVQSTGTGDLTG
jgi:(2Fe-2S) ferredoxin